MNPLIEALLLKHEVKTVHCRRISDAIKHFDPSLNEQGFSEEWDRAGLFSETTKTIYLANEGWDGDAPKQYEDTKKAWTRAHETGHAVDFCLNRPSRTKDFLDAMKEDLKNFPFREEYRDKILGRLNGLSAEASGELWANFFEVAHGSEWYEVGADYFPKTLELFNREVAHLNVGHVRLSSITKTDTSNGKTATYSVRVLMPS